MKTLKNLFKIAAVAALVIVAAPSKAQVPVVWNGGNILTNVFTASALTSNSCVDVSKPPSQFVAPYVARDSSWFEVPKNQAVAIQVEYSGQATNNFIVFEGSLNPTSKTNWTNTRLLTVNLPTITLGGVVITNIPAASLANIRGIRLGPVVNTNTAGSIIITNVIVGTWK
jgi:hypothetical protein